MKLLFVSRKRYQNIEKQNLNLALINLNLTDDLDVLKSEYAALIEKIKENDNHIETLDKQINLAADFNDKVTNINCELVIKLVAAEKKITDLEFCLSDCKKENKNLAQVLKNSNLVKEMMLKLIAKKDNKGKISYEDGQVIINDKVSSKKVYEIVRMLG